jgi:hypothetical protein
MEILIDKTLYGQDTGKFYGDSLLYNIKRGNTTYLSIKPDHLSDSFWKGFFEESMYYYKDVEIINRYVHVDATNSQIEIMQVNLKILSAIVNNT